MRVPLKLRLFFLILAGLVSVFGAWWEKPTPSALLPVKEPVKTGRQSYAFL